MHPMLLPVSAWVQLVAWDRRWGLSHGVDVLFVWDSCDVQACGGG